MDVYIQPVKKAELHNKNNIRLMDISELVCSDEIKNKLSQLELIKINSKVKANYVISATDIVEKIIKASPGCTVNNLGEKEVLIDYKPEIKKINKPIECLKMFFVSMMLFIGSSTAIMSFQSEAQLLKIFKNYYKIFLGVETDKPVLITIPYSIGLCVGILVFFNHIFNKKLTSDPTPIEVEINTYDEDVTKSIVATINIQEKENESN